MPRITLKFAPFLSVAKKVDPPPPKLAGAGGCWGGCVTAKAYRTFKPHSDYLCARPRDNCRTRHLRKLFPAKIVLSPAEGEGGREENPGTVLASQESTHRTSKARQQKCQLSRLAVSIFEGV